MLHRSAGLVRGASKQHCWFPEYRLLALSFFSGSAMTHCPIGFTDWQDSLKKNGRSDGVNWLNAEYQSKGPTNSQRGVSCRSLCARIGPWPDSLEGKSFLYQLVWRVGLCSVRNYFWIVDHLGSIVQAGDSG